MSAEADEAGGAAMQCIEVPAGRLAAVVTSLEMLALPPLREEHVGADLRLHRVARPEISWYREIFRRVGQDWLWFSRLQLDDKELGAILGNPLVEVYSVRQGVGDEGLLELDFRENETCELGFFGLTRALVGKGAGRWLMNRALEIVWSRKVRRFWVHTCTCDHQDAVSFYVRSGFRPFRQHVEITEDPRLTGILPRHVAPHAPIILDGEGD